MSSEDTRIPVSKHTRERLKSFGCKGETYDDIIQDLIAERKFWKSLDRFKNKIDMMERLEEAGVENYSGNISKYFNDQNQVKDEYKNN